MRHNETILHSSGNVFADLGLPNPDEEMAKAVIALAVLQQIDARRLTQARAANLAQTTPMRIRQLWRGKLSAFTHTELTRLLRGVGILCFVLFLNMQAGAGIHKIAKGHAKPKTTGRPRPIHYAVVSPDGRLGASFRGPSDICVWNRRTKRLLYTLKHTLINDENFKQVSTETFRFSRSGGWLLIIDAYYVALNSLEPHHGANRLHIWSMATGYEIVAPMRDIDDVISCFAFTPDDATLVYDCIGKYGSTCTLYKVNLTNGRCQPLNIYDNGGEANTGYETMLTPDGKTYKAIGFGPDRIIDVATLKPARTL